MQKQNLASVYRLSFRTLFFLLVGLLLSTLSWGQRVTRQISKEIVVPADVVVKTRGPEEIYFTGNGTINVWQEDGKQKLSAKERSPVIYEFDQHMEVQSWEENKVKQVVEVTVACPSPDETEALLDALAVSLQLNRVNEVTIGCELNIDRFMIENGWLKPDKNTIELDDGRVFNVVYLSLSSKLYIPKQATFKLKSEWTSIEMSDHVGPVNINMHGGTFKASRLADLKANFSSTQLEIAHLKRGDLQLQAIRGSLGTVEHLELSSSISTLEIDKVDTLIAENLLSDNLQLGEAGRLQLDDARFAELGIRSLTQSANLNGRNTNLSLTGGEFQELTMDNELAVVDVQLSSNVCYLLEVVANAPEKIVLPAGIKLLEQDGRRKIYRIGTGDTPRLLKLNCQGCEIKIE